MIGGKNRYLSKKKALRKRRIDRQISYDGNHEMYGNHTWKIFSKLRADEDGKTYGVDVRPKDYKRKCDATRVANKLNKESINFEYVVSKTNPWPKDGDV